MRLNIIISFAGLKSSQSSAPYALQRLAGSTILGHILVFLFDLQMDKLTLLVGSGREQVQDWMQQHLPDIAVSVLLVEEADDPVSGLQASQSALDSTPTLFVSGNYVIEADYPDLIVCEANASCLVQAEQDSTPSALLGIDEDGFLTAAADAREVMWAGSFYFRSGSDLGKALDAMDRQGSRGVEGLLSQLAAQGAEILTKQAVHCLKIQSNEDLLHANAWLLRIDHGSQDAIERSYAEDFTVIPPVFLHETAVIEYSVIGPFVNLEANASVRNSVVRNSLIGLGAQIADAVLDGSLIGDNAVITGQASALIAGDGVTTEIRPDHN